MSRMLLLVVLLTACTSSYGQLKLEGSFVSKHNVRWVYNYKTGRDDQINAPKGELIIIRFSANQVITTEAKGFNARTYKVYAVSTDYFKQTSGERRYDYKLEDERGKSIELLATVMPKTKGFQFDFFEGNDRRTTYTNDEVFAKRVKTN